MTNKRRRIRDADFEQANQDFREIGFGTFDLEATPVLFKEIPTQYTFSEWREKKGDIELHIYHPRKHPTLQWSLVEYASKLYDAIIDEFRLSGFQDRLLVEFVPEVNAWFVKIRNVAAIETPKEERLVRMIDQAGPGGA